jgi:hypothetical protein
MFTIDCSKTHDKIQHISLWIVLGPMGIDKIQHKAELLGLSYYVLI